MRRVAIVILAVGMLAAGCSGGTASPINTTVSSSPTSSVTSTTSTGGKFLSGVLPRSLAVPVAERGHSLVRGMLVAADDASLTIEVFDVLAGAPIGGVAAGAVAVIPTYDPVTHAGWADLLIEAVAAQGGSLPVMLMLTPDGRVTSVYVLDESLLRFSRDEVSEPRPVFVDSNEMAEAIDGGVIRAEVVSPVDPDQFTYCIGNVRRVQSYRPVTGDEVADVLAFGMAMLAEPDLPPVPEAQHLAETTVFVDEVTGLTTTGWATDVVDQAWRGVAFEDLVVHRTVPIRLRQGGFGWQTQIVVLAEAGTGRVLGWWDGNPTAKRITTEVMVPPTGAGLEVYRRDWTVDPNICVGGGPYMVIPYDQVAGSRRATINLVNRTVRDWDGP